MPGAKKIKGGIKLRHDFFFKFLGINFFFLLFLFLFHKITMSNNNASTSQPTGAQAAVFVESVEMPKDSLLIKGPDFNQSLSLTDLLSSYKAMGFQASSLGNAIEIVEQMV